MPSIECRQLTCRFGERDALRGVSFSVESESFAYIIGPSGGGKTTLLRAVAGLQGLDAGSVSIDAKTASNERIVIAPADRRIGYLPQEPSLWPHLSVAANVALGLRPAPWSRAARLNRACEWLGEFDLGALADRFPGELSGGEARWATLVRALAGEPRILLLDEPAAHLDLHLRRELMKRIRRIHAERGLTTLCVTHQIEPPMRAEDRIVILEKGTIAFDGPFARILDAPASEFTDALKSVIKKPEDWLE